MPYFVYLLANRKFGALSLGVTNDLARRVYQHKSKLLPGFTARIPDRRFAASGMTTKSSRRPE